ncbi:MAG: sulfite exporter TauE/SafE family protein [Desulfobacteraceae bacterium]|nr:sulfite exporter TauE/SafE family protein [Desulfobacteraceae bacterium]
MDLIIYLCCIAFVGGLVQGLTGFGVVLVALPLMGFFIDIKTAIPLILLLSLVINFTLISRMLKHFDYKKWILLFIFSLPGIPLGIIVLKYVNPRYLELLIGWVVIFTSVFSMFNSASSKEPHKFWAGLAGFISGFLGGSIGATGPPIVIYTSLQPWDKEQIKTTMVSYFILTGLGILIFYIFNNLITKQILISFGYCVMPLISGVACGIFIFNRINDTLYRRIINLLLVFLGIMLLIK